MAFAKGDLITADAMNNYYSTFGRTWSWGHQGWSWRTVDTYFYCTRTAGVVLLQQSNTTSTGNQKKLTLWRYENGAWVQKDYSDTASGTKTIYMYSHGIGAYCIRINDHNNTPTLLVCPCKGDNVKGNFLAMLDSDPLSQTESSSINVNPRCHDFITADTLNNGRVYTI